MKYCSKCGNELIDEAIVCTNCGCGVNPHRTAKADIPEKDEADVGLIILSAIVPIIGFILWALKYKDTPNAARTYGTAALIVCGVWIVIYVFISVLVSSTVSGLIEGFM
ncbi:MAG: zinc ribbon domain-containing protein [Clostridia bacterium]|nr:zinc ribbon domain-containing protein [Clostridia bacterium]